MVTSIRSHDVASDSNARTAACGSCDGQKVTGPVFNGGPGSRAGFDLPTYRYADPGPLPVATLRTIATAPAPPWSDSRATATAQPISASRPTRIPTPPATLALVLALGELRMVVPEMPNVRRKGEEFRGGVRQ